MKMSRIAGLLAAGILTLQSPPANADKRTDALVLRGMKLRGANRNREALEAFESAYRRSKEARALAQIALTERALGRLIAAERHLKQALARADPWINAQSQSLLRVLADIQSRLCSLRVVVPDVTGATVLVNGKRRGSSPMTKAITVIAGTVVVEVRADGYHPMVRRLTVAAGTLVRERFILVPKSTPTLEPPPSNPVSPKTQAPKPAAPMPMSPTNNSAIVADGKVTESTVNVSTGPELSLPAYITTGGAMVAIGVGITFLFVRNNNITAFNDDSTCLTGNQTRGERCGNRLDAANTAEGIMVGAFVSGGILTAAAAILFLLDRPDDDLASAVAPGPGDIGLSMTTRF